MPATQPAAAPEREQRGARRRRETRIKLMDAAFRLMAERDFAAIKINEITEAADVGIGSFYNHFETKELLYAAVCDAVFEQFGDALDALASELSDPAEIIAVSIRHTMRRAQREPLWGRFLVRESHTSNAFSKGLGARLLRDIEHGSKLRRFKTPDPLLSVIGVGGTVLAAISATSQLSVPQPEARLPFDVDVATLPERTATAALQTLGLTYETARRIAHRPLPVDD
ncbi:TetR/AcrR family transcriptional regulator [Solimonas marina]|uniref:TetR/AcrR family transcriptional regulator n=1 Tax=Solimonas marina TaxID=2714601 RepID=A0A969WA12_9GAMM|nr:TetR/AcrR family transcriptional regulator [Solimonas marina]NKF23531.1 TetR/AcrR family transcriptional regulator [Solimonas marina]